jgi:hypothetical protein
MRQAILHGSNVTLQPIRALDGARLIVESQNRKKEHSEVNPSVETRKLSTLAV